MGVWKREYNFFPGSNVGEVSLEQQESNGCLYRSQCQKDENNDANLLPRIFFSYFLVAFNETKQKGFVKH